MGFVKRFVLIDGNGILHRAYHAFPPLTNPRGEVVNAVYGFFQMFLNVIHDLKPDYVAVCFDRSKPTIRQSMYAGYHAHRPKMADDFGPQVAVVDELLERMQVQIFALDGYEGDDLVGTLATRVQNAESKSKHGEIETIIVTGDRDMLQLVNSHTKVMMPQTGITKTVLFDEARVAEKYGVQPSQFIDYKALIGDASDGYPGVSGIGPKTAAALLSQYHTFEQLYTRIGELPEKVGKMLATDAEQAALAKKLATIITDAPVQFDLEMCKDSHFDIAALKEGFEEHAFKSLVEKLNQRYPRHEKKREKKNTSSNQLGLEF